MCNPSGRAVHFSRGRLARNTQLIDEVEHRRLTFGEIRHFGEPVVLLRVDVEVEVVGPAHAGGQPVIPDSLQRQRQRGVGARTSDRQVTAVLEEKRGQARVGFAGPHSLAPLIGWHSLCRGVRAQVDGHAAIESLVVFNVCSAQLGVGLVPQGFKAVHSSRCRIGAAEIGGDGNEESYAIRIADVQCPVVCCDVAALGDDANARLKGHALLAIAVHVFERVTFENQGVIALDSHVAGKCEVRKAEVAVDRRRLIACEARDQDVCGIGRKHFALEAEFAAGVVNMRNGFVEAKGSAITLLGVIAGKRNLDRSHGQVCTERRGPAK